MSRSKKKPVKKDKPRNVKASIYFRRIRRTWKTQLVSQLRKDLENLYLEDSKNIVNQYDYCDYISKCFNDEECYCLKNYGFKKCSNK